MIVIPAIEMITPMLIVDAFRRSATTHEVCFLLTNYVETLQFYDSGKHLPAGITHLPVIGVDDVEARHVALRGALTQAYAQQHAHGALLNEATEVFFEALSRLKTLLNAPSPTPHVPLNHDMASHARL